MAKNKFLRTCICCNETKHKDELYRFTVIKGEVVLDFYKKLEGRGFYVCKNSECLKKLNKKVIEKNMKREINEFNKEKILKSLKNMLRSSIINLVKICNKSGKAIASTNRVLNLNDRIHLLIIAEDISKNTFNKLQLLIDRIPSITEIFKKDELGNIFSKQEVSVVAITDKTFAEKLKNLYTEYLGV